MWIIGALFIFFKIPVQVEPNPLQVEQILVQVPML